MQNSPSPLKKKAERVQFLDTLCSPNLEGDRIDAAIQSSRTQRNVQDLNTSAISKQSAFTTTITTSTAPTHPTQKSTRQQPTTTTSSKLLPLPIECTTNSNSTDQTLPKKISKLIENDDADSNSPSQFLSDNNRRISNQKQQDKIKYKRVIDGLDLWQAEQKQAKIRSRQFSSFHTIDHHNHNRSSNGGISINGGGSSSSKALKPLINEVNSPNLNIAVLDFILQTPSVGETPAMLLPKAKDNLIKKEKDFSSSSVQVSVAGSRPNSTLKGGDPKRQQSQQLSSNEDVNNRTEVQNYPRSLDQLPTRPMTLISLKMRNIDDLKLKSVNRYSYDSKKNLVAKNDQQLHAEQNHEIINSLFRMKVSKAIEKHKPSTKGEYNEMVQMIAGQYKSETLANFKNLTVLANNFICQEMDRESNAAKNLRYGDIEYAKLYEELFEDKLLKRLFGGIVEDAQQSSLAASSQQLQARKARMLTSEEERAMMKAYEDFQKKVREVKDRVNLGRKNLSEIVMKRRFAEDDFKKKREEFNKKLYQAEQELQLNERRMSSEKTEEQLDMLKQLKRQYQDKVNEIKKQRTQWISQKSSEIETIHEKEEESQMSLTMLLSDYNELKMSRDSIRFQLKQFFLLEMNSASYTSSSSTASNSNNNNIGKSNDNKGSSASSNNYEDIPTKGLVYTILKFFAINEEVTYNYFPDHLDETSMGFLLEWAKLEQSVRQMRSKISYLQYQNRHRKTASQGILQARLPQENQQQQGIQNDNLREMANQILSSPRAFGTATPIRAIGGAQGSFSQPSSPFQSLNSSFIEIQTNPTNNQTSGISSPRHFNFLHAFGSENYRDLDKVIQSKPKRNVIYEQSTGSATVRLLEDEIRTALQKIETLKEKEAERIFSLNIKESATCKSIFFSLFGSTQGEKFLFENLRKQQRIEQKIAATHTFRFLPPTSSTYRKQYIESNSKTNSLVQKQLNNNNNNNGSNNNSNSNMNKSNQPIRLVPPMRNNSIHDNVSNQIPLSERTISTSQHERQMREISMKKITEESLSSKLFPSPKANFSITQIPRDYILTVKSNKAKPIQSTNQEALENNLLAQKSVGFLNEPLDWKHTTSPPYFESNVLN